MLKHIKKYSFSEGILLASLLLVGGFHEYISCILAVVLSTYLLVKLKKGQKLTIRKDLLTSAMVAVAFGYGLTCLWAIDRGMAFVGFLKFLPLFLYLICLQQEKQTEQVLTALPYFGAAMAVISAIGMQLPMGDQLFSVAGRLGGFFQYPNTFAVFLLICELLLLKKTGKKLADYIILVLLIGGFLYTGSRTAFVVAILANTAMLLAVIQKKTRRILLLAMAAVVLAAILLLLSGNFVMRRYLTISLTESTFIGRLLYWIDALPLLLKHPFGMGYMGYYYVQQGIQTGVYSVAFIHNDFLQLLLDVGWVPAGLFFGALVKWFIQKNIPVTDKIIVGAFCLHSFFDFNMQFIGVFFLLLLLLSRHKTEKVLQCKPGILSKVGLVTAALAGIYLCVALSAARFGARPLADTIYPYNTQNKLSMLEQETDLAKANALADEILSQNDDFYAPYTIKARYCYSQGDFGSLIQYEREALDRNPFLHTEYEDYGQMLITGIDLYRKAGDFQSAEVCKKELLYIQQRLSDNEKRLSKLGKMINDQPVTELSYKLQEYIRGMGE